MRNLSYELAKQLKDAGFKQEGDGSYVYRSKDEPYSEESMEQPYSPTLSELIEACPKIYIIRRTGLEDNETWAVCAIDNIDFYGKIPKEAVAKLYLDQNGKKESPSDCEKEYMHSI